MASPPIFSEVATATDTGRVRANNEDACCGDARTGVLAVADGIGGHPAGEVASALAIATVRTMCAQWVHGSRFPLLDAEAEAELRELFRRAHQLIVHGMQRVPERAGMGTTLTVAVVAGERLHVAHAGDSPAFLIRRGKGLRPLTAAHAQGNVLDSSLGVSGTLRKVDVSHYVCRPGDVVLVASDGLTHDGDVWMATAMRMAETERSVREIADALIKYALDAGGHDNVTVAVGRVA